MSHELRMGYGPEPNVTIFACNFVCVYESRSLYSVCVTNSFFRPKIRRDFFWDATKNMTLLSTCDLHLEKELCSRVIFGFVDVVVIESYFFVNTVRTPTVNYKWK